MIRKKLTLTILTSVILFALLFSSCSDGLVSLKYEDGVLYNSKLNLRYVNLPTYIEPVAVGEEYAVYKDRDLTLYEIPGLDPEKWLTESYFGIASVFCTEDIQISSLSEFEPNSAIVCISDEITFGLATISDSEKLAEIVDLFENGTAEEYPLIDSIDLYSLKFTSEKYPNIYYNLTFGIFEEGEFLYDRYSKRAVRADGLLDGIIITEAVSYE